MFCHFAKYLFLPPIAMMFMRLNQLLYDVLRLISG